MRLTLTILMIVSAAIMAAVTRGSAYYSDASGVSSILSSAFSSNSFEVNIEYESGVGNSYFVLYDSSSNDAISGDQTMAAIYACALVSASTSWSSAYVVIGFLGNGTAWEITTADARYLVENASSRGDDWAFDYMFSHMTQIL